MSLSKHAAVPVSDDMMSELIAAGHQAADAAAAITMEYFRQPLRIDNKAGDQQFDPVTQADKESELVIREVLIQRFPDIGFYGEEHDSVESTSGLTWVVDPIDGTRAFMSGMPMWGTLIGLFDGENAILGLMDQPFLKERFIASSGKALLINEQGEHVLRTRRVPSLSQSTMYCTTPDMFDTDLSRQRFNAVKDACQLTRYGGDCYAYALLASGHVDVVLDCDLKPYDIQALIPIVESAGGVVSNWEGGSAVDGGFVVAAATEEIHEQTLALLQAD